MMKGILSLLLIAFQMVLFVGCTYRSKAIVDPKFGTYQFTTFTVDTLRFRVLLNDNVLTDSLVSPQGNFSKTVSFLDSNASLLIINTRNNQVILDTFITLKTGTTTISLVQFTSGQTPFLPPTPNEPPPATGNYKTRFQYLRPSNPDDPSMKFYDSVRCFIARNGAPYDTIILKKYGLSEFYEAPAGIGFSMQKIESPNGVKLNLSPTNQVTFSKGFNTVALFGSSGPSAPLYGFTLLFIYQ